MKDSHHDGHSSPISINEKLKNQSQTLSADHKKLKKKRLRFRLFVFCVGLFLVWGAWYWWNQEKAITEMEQQLSDIRTQVQMEHKKQLELLDQIDRLHDLDYIAEIARRDYFLSPEGEILFKIPD